MRALIEHLSEQIAALDKEIDKNNRDGFGGKGEILKDVPGVGKITCATILSMLPELGRVQHKRAALLVGVVPPSLQSGEKEGKRGCVGGRMAGAQRAVHGRADSDAQGTEDTDIL